MKILVLGGTGAMGVPVVKILAEQHNEIYVTTRKKLVSENDMIHYISGDAHDMNFVKNLMTQKFDTVIDFMVYTSNEFKERMELFLSNTKQYIFLSSARVYADAGEELITEKSARLLDISQDRVYLKTDEYALAKAREEDLLQKSGYKNWTIIRPYITYNNHRLQLGALEKESWLPRILEGKKLVFCKDIAMHYTTLTYGEDVALRIVDLVGCESALGETFHITGKENIKWSQVMEVYLDVLEQKLAKRPEIYWLDSAEMISKVCNNQYQIKYDRLYDRKFDSSKIENFTQEKSFVKTEEGLKKSLFDFLEGDCAFRARNWRLEAVFDRVTGEHTNIWKISGWKNKLRYLLMYCFYWKRFC